MALPQPPGFRHPTTPTEPKTLVSFEEAKALAEAKKLERADVSFIFKQYLLPQHQTDPNVIAFIRNYLRCRDAGQAAREAGLNKRDGENLKRRPDIHEAIRVVTEQALMKHGYDAAEVVEKVKEIAFVDPADFQKPDGSFVESLHELEPGVRRAIKKMVVRNEYGEDPNGMKVVTGRIITIELWDKMKATELLGRDKDIFKETRKVEHDITKNMADTLLESQRIAAEAALPATYRDVGESE